MKPRIVVRQKHDQFVVTLTRSRVASRLGYKGIVLIKTWTREAAEDWICRFRGIRSKAQVLKIVAPNRIIRGVR